MLYLKRILLFVSLIVALAAHAETVKLLTIGNSFADNALSALEPIAKAAGDTLICGRANIGGCSFQRHVEIMRAYENDLASPAGRKYHGGKSLKELLQQEQWDYVTIQQASPLSFDYATFQPYANELIAYIRKHTPQATILIHQTWAYRDDHSFWDKPSMTADTMYRGVREAYSKLAAETGLRIIPSGDVFEAARQSPEWGKPDFSEEESPSPDIKHPDLPKQPSRALHLGYVWGRDKDGERKLIPDRYHANKKGEYLLGCLWYETLFKKSAVGNPNRRGVTDEEAAILQKIAHEVAGASGAK